MADKAHPAGRAPVAEAPANVRNVVLVGHSGAGKTTLVEALLAATGTISRAGRVEDGTTVTDFDDAEVRQQRSVSLALAPLVVLRDGTEIKVNLLDAPGYADFDAIVATCQEAFGEGVLPMYLPMHTDDGGVGGLLGLLSQRVIDYSGGTREEREPDAEHLPLIAGARNALIEGIIAESEDESLMDRYLACEDIDSKVLVDDLERAVARGSFYPVLATAALTGLGSTELLELLADAFPSPLEHDVPPVSHLEGRPHDPLSCDPAGPLVAEVIKTTTDPYVGRISLVRVFAGTLRPDTMVHVSGHGLTERGHEDHDVDERVGALSSPLGKTQRPVPQCVAGDIVAVAKLSRAETGDTLSDKDRPLLMVSWTMPQPLLPVAIKAKSKADEDKLSQS